MHSGKPELRHHQQSFLPQTSLVLSATGSLELRLVSSAILEHTNNNTSHSWLGLVIVSNDRRTLTCLITCKKCKAQYVGQTHQKCANYMNNHKFDIVRFPGMFTNVSEHFNSPGHTIQDFSFMPIEKVENKWNRFLKETSWMHILCMTAPKGMNSKVLF